MWGSNPSCAPPCHCPLSSQRYSSHARASTVLARYSHLLKVRGSTPAFHPNARQDVRPSREVLHIVRGNQVHCLINVTAAPQSAAARGTDLITGQPFGGTLRPYQVAWVTA